jgi:uncharacterized membrane protein
MEAFASDINDNRQVVGLNGYYSGSQALGFFWENGEASYIEYPGTNFTFAGGLNNRGMIVGEYRTGDPPFGPIQNHGFLLIGDQYTTLALPMNNSYAMDINNRGDLIGHYCDDSAGSVPGCQARVDRAATGVPGDVFHSYLLGRRGLVTINYPGALHTWVSSINNRGDVIGAYSPDGVVQRGFVRGRRGRFYEIDVPDAIQTNPWGINTSGEIVGAYFDAAGGIHGFYRNRKGEFSTLDFPGANGTSITGINDRGDLVGVYLDDVFSFKAFVALKESR